MVTIKTPPIDGCLRVASGRVIKKKKKILKTIDVWIHIFSVLGFLKLNERYGKKQASFTEIPTWMTFTESSREHG